MTGISLMGEGGNSNENYREPQGLPPPVQRTKQTKASLCYVNGLPLPHFVVEDACDQRPFFFGKPFGSSFDRCEEVGGFAQSEEETGDGKFERAISKLRNQNYALRP